MITGKKEKLDNLTSSKESKLYGLTALVERIPDIDPAAYCAQYSRFYSDDWGSRRSHANMLNRLLFNAYTMKTIEDSWGIGFTKISKLGKLLLKLHYVLTIVLESCPDLEQRLAKAQSRDRHLFIDSSTKKIKS